MGILYPQTSGFHEVSRLLHIIFSHSVLFIMYEERKATRALEKLEAFQSNSNSNSRCILFLMDYAWAVSMPLLIFFVAFSLLDHLRQPHGIYRRLEYQ
jgi:hypothetical protein